MHTSNQTLRTINVEDPFALRYWARQLRITEVELRAAIAAAGTNIDAVRRHVGNLAPRERGRTGRPRA